MCLAAPQDLLTNAHIKKILSKQGRGSDRALSEFVFLKMWGAPQHFFCAHLLLQSLLGFPSQGFGALWLCSAVQAAVAWVQAADSVW